MLMVEMSVGCLCVWDVCAFDVMPDDDCDEFYTNV